MNAKNKRCWKRHGLGQRLQMLITRFCALITFLYSFRPRKESDDASDKFPASEHELDVCTYSIVVLATMSAGKSTLLNAIIGKELLPSKNEACTSTIFQIEDIDQQTDFTARAIEKTKMSEWVPISKDALEVWNKKGYQQIEIRGNLPNIVNADGKHRVIFFDTPGSNNALETQHAKIADRILQKTDYCAMICVLNASVLGVDDEWKLLSHIQKVIAKNGRKNIQLFFAVNKIDLLDIEKGEDPIDTVNRIQTYLENLKFVSPLLIPISSSTSLLMRTALKAKTKMTFRETLLECKGIEKITAIFKKRYKSTLTKRQQKNLKNTIILYKELSEKYRKIFAAFPHLNLVFTEFQRRKYHMHTSKMKIAGTYFTFDDFYQVDFLSGVPILEKIIEDSFDKHIDNVKNAINQGEQAC